MSQFHKINRPLLSLIAAFAILVVLHSLTTPLFEAPDEVWHYAYTRWLAEGHGLPSMLDNASGANQEVAQPPLYYGLAALLNSAFDDADLHDLSWHNPGFGYQAEGTLPDNKNMLIHTDQESWPWHGAVLAIRAARLASLIFGIVTVIASWGLGYEAFQSRQAAAISAALVAFHPQFIFISSVTNNDSAAAALSTAALWSAAHAIRHDLTPKRAVLAGALVGFAMISKTSALALLPLIGFMLLWSSWQKKESSKQLLINLGLYIVAALIAGGWWYLRNALLYGDPLGITSHLDTLWGRPQPVPLWALWPEIPLLLRSFWAAYGWGHIFWPTWIYVILTSLSIYLLVCGAYKVKQHQTQKTKTPFYKDATIIILGMAFSWLGLIFMALLYWMQQVEAPHGRLLFPAIGAWALLLTAASLPTSKSKNRVTSRILILSMAIIATLAPGARILATFAPPRLYTPETITENLSLPTQLKYENQARLLGVTVTPERLIPGETVEVQACWEALNTIQQDYTVFVHLLGPENQIVAMRHTYPGLGKFPTSLWPVGKAFCDTYKLPVEPDTDTPILYNLEVGLFNAETGGRLTATAPDGTPAKPPIVAQVAVVPDEPYQISPTTALNATFEEKIALHGYDAPQSVRAGQTITITLYWETLETVNEDLIAFTHLWEPGEPQPFAQDDTQPQQGWYPTTVWQAGDIIQDTHILEIPPDLAAGHYPLWGGLYRAEDTTRLSAIGAQGRYTDDLVPLGEIEVKK